MADDGKTMPADLKAWLKVFSADLTKRMDRVQEHLVNVDTRLSNMEHGGPTDYKEDTNATAAAKAKLECDATAKDLEVDTKHAMEAIRCAFLKDKMESSNPRQFPILWSR
jgi:hypothetical protein